MRNGFHDFDRVQHQHRSELRQLDTSTKTAYAVLAAILIWYTFQYLDPIDVPLSRTLWDILVWITPPRMVARFDSVFEKAMTEEKKGTESGHDFKEHVGKSNAMRRILGLDGTGILSTVQRTRTLSDLSGVFKARSDGSPPGLGNWDNSCYQNSVLQGLAALGSLPAFLNQNVQSDEPPSTKSALRDLIGRLNDPANVGKTIWTPAELKSMSSWQQQDAQEYFSKISDEMEKDSSEHVKHKMKHGGLEKLPLKTSDEKPNDLPELNSITTAHSSSMSKVSSSVGQLPEDLLSLIVRNPLEGLLAQRVGCQNCGFVEGLSLVPFNCLTVSLGRDWMYDVRSCLEEYTALEPINGVECGKCTLLRAKRSLEQVLRSIKDRGKAEDHPSRLESSQPQESPLHKRLKLVDKALDDQDFSDQILKRCQIPQRSRVSTTKSRQAVIARTPKCLVIHVNRSTFDELTGVQSKNMAHVRFPRRLNLAPWCLGNPPTQDQEDNSVESWNTNPSESMLADEYSGDLGSNRDYELRAVITHYGRHENGHYICYRKSRCSSSSSEKTVDESKEAWWRLSDEDVTEVDEETVLSQGGVFMLFYEQMAPSIHPQHHKVPLQHTALDDVDETLKKVETEMTSVIKEDSSSDADTKKQSDQPIAPIKSGLPTPPSTPSQLNPRSEPSSLETGHEPTQNSNAVDPTNDLSSGPSESSPSPSPTESSLLEPSKNPEPPLPKAKNDSGAPPQQQASSEPLKEKQPVSPASMRTAAPRSGRGRAMGSVAGYVQAN